MDTSNALSVEMIDVKGTVLRSAMRPGNTDRPPLVLLNGIGAKIEALDRFVDVYNPDSGVIVFDIPGVGGSPKPTKSMRMPDMARMLGDLLDHYGFAQADVFGVSWGGALAQEFAHTCPTRCRRLVLGATATGMMMFPGNPMAMMSMMNPMRFIKPGYMGGNMMSMYGGKLKKNPQLLGNLGDHMAGGSGALGAMKVQMSALMGWSSLSWLHTIMQPTLVIAGKDDPIVPPINAQMIAKRIPNAGLAMVDCGHLFVLTLAAEVAAMVDAFLGHPM